MCFLTDMSTFGEFNDAYVAAFGDHRPARSTIGVAALPLNGAVEIEAWAYSLRLAAWVLRLLFRSQRTTLIHGRRNCDHRVLAIFPVLIAMSGGVASAILGAVLQRDGELASRAVNCSISTTERLKADLCDAERVSFVDLVLISVTAW